MDFGFPALNCIPWWRTWDSGLQSLVRFQIPKPTILDSTGKIIDPGFRNRRAKLLGFRIPGAKLLGFQIPRAKPLGVRNPDSLTWGDLFLGLHQRTGDSRTCGTCRRQATRLQPLPANYSVCMYVCMYVCRPATLSSRSRPYSQYPAWCSLQTPERVYKLLCGVFNRKSWSATSYFSATSVYSCHGVFKG